MDNKIKQLIYTATISIPIALLILCYFQRFSPDESITILLARYPAINFKVSDSHTPITYLLWTPFTLATSFLKPIAQLFTLRIITLSLMLASYLILLKKTSRFGKLNAIIFSMLFAASELLLTRGLEVRYYSVAIFLVTLYWITLHKQILNLFIGLVAISNYPLSFIPICLIQLYEYSKDNKISTEHIFNLSTFFVVLLVIGVRKALIHYAAPQVYYEFDWLTVVEYLLTLSFLPIVFINIYNIKKSVLLIIGYFISLPIILYSTTFLGLASARYLVPIVPFIFAIAVMYFNTNIMRIERTLNYSIENLSLKLYWKNYSAIILPIILLFIFIIQAFLIYTNYSSIIKDYTNAENHFYFSADNVLAEYPKIYHAHLRTLYPLYFLEPNKPHIIYMNQLSEQGTLPELAKYLPNVYIFNTTDFATYKLPFVQATSYKELCYAARTQLKYQNFLYDCVYEQINRTPDYDFDGLGVWLQNESETKYEILWQDKSEQFNYTNTKDIELLYNQTEIYKTWIQSNYTNIQ